MNVLIISDEKNDKLIKKLKIKQYLFYKRADLSNIDFNQEIQAIIIFGTINLFNQVANHLIQINKDKQRILLCLSHQSNAIRRTFLTNKTTYLNTPSTKYPKLNFMKINNRYYLLGGGIIKNNPQVNLSTQIKTNLKKNKLKTKQKCEVIYDLGVVTGDYSEVSILNKKGILPRSLKNFSNIKISDDYLEIRLIKNNYFIVGLFDIFKFLLFGNIKNKNKVLLFKKMNLKFESEVCMLVDNECIINKEFKIELYQSNISIVTKKKRI